ncbi:MAG: glutamine--tRNA ligase/YqeY domain fusion protein [Saprospiraceae bacterium]
MSTEKVASLNFIEQIIEEDLRSGKNDKKVLTRFPPEPNGYLHIGHAKAICLNFSIAQKYNGATNLRFDDTNPTTEETAYVDAIKRDIEWLGFTWAEELYASDYFDQMYAFAQTLIKKGLAYVDDSTPEEIAEMKGTPNEPGVDSPFRSRSIEENLTLFAQMKAGDFPDGSKVLRAKIDMKSPNMLMRDPVFYRIKHETHHRTGDKWCIYPLYDFAHGQSDSIEGITHSLCTLEFIHHRPLYNWCIEQLEIFPSQQIEFARMNVEYMITSKRKLLQLVQENIVTGWDDPRMPTISGMRRKGYPAAGLRLFCDKVGIAKRDNVIEISLLEASVREVLNKETSRVMAVMNPIKLVITNYDEAKTEMLKLVNNPEDPDSGTREVPFSKELYMERGDVLENAPKKFYRMDIGRNVRLKGAYIVHCESFDKDETTGEITTVYCSYYPNSKSGEDESGIKSKGVIHWVSIPHAIQAEVRMYDHLFTVPNPLEDKDKDFKDFINPDSQTILDSVYVEPSLKTATAGTRLQFMRKGYFCVDPDASPTHLVFNQTVGLKDRFNAKKGKK